ncbi:MAG TPA: DUF502 domain-containing protein [Gemmatimonadaceae bacterium]|jgi:uncharacterized membrane protein
MNALVSEGVTRLLNYFLRGLVVVVPLALTIYVCAVIFTTIDSWLGLPIRGVGFLLTIALIVFVGALASSFVTRSLITALDNVLDRLPFVRLLYSSAKDMLNAFVGEKKRFDKPVLVAVSNDRAVKVIAFLTSDSLSSLGLADQVTVYMPQSYGFAGHILVVPADRVERIDADAAEVMAFIISGGVTTMEARGDRGKSLRGA